MAVEIPKIQRFDVQGPESVGRLQAEVPNFVAPTNAVLESVQSGLSKGVQAKQQYDTQVRKATVNAWDIKTSDLSNQFETWYKTELSAIGLKDGDTTKDYADLDTKAQLQRKKLFEGFETMEPEFQTLLNRKADGTIGKLQGLRDIQQSTQNYKYKDKVFDNTSKLNVDNFMSYGIYLDVKNPSTFLALDKFKNDITQARLAQADQQGFLERNENGTVNPLAGMSGVKIRQDMGDAIIPLVTSLNAAGKVAEANKIIKDYDEYLNAADKARLISGSNDADLRNRAITKLVDITGKLGGRLPELSDIDAYKDATDVERFKMKELNEINQRQAKMQNERKAETAVSREYERLITTQSGAKPYVSKADYANSPEYQNIKDKLDPAQQNHLLGMVDAPLKSKAASVEAYNDGIKNNNLYKMPVSERLAIKSGLSKEYRDEFDKTVTQQLADSKKIKKPGDDVMSESTGSAMHARMHTALEKQMKNYKLPNGDQLFETNKKGKFTESYDNDLLNSFSNFVRKDIRDLGKTPSYAEQQQIIDKRFSEMKQQRTKDTEGTFRSFFGPADFKEPEYKPILINRTKRPALTRAAAVPQALTVQPASTDTTQAASSDTTQVVVKPTTPKVSPSGKVTGLPPITDRKNWIKLYRQANGTGAPSPQALQEWAQDKINKAGN